MAPVKKFWNKRKRGTDASTEKPKARRQRSLTTETAQNSTINDESSDDGHAAAKKVRWGTVEAKSEEDGVSTVQDDDDTTEEIQITNDAVSLCFYSKRAC